MVKVISNHIHHDLFGHVIAPSCVLSHLTIRSTRRRFGFTVKSSTSAARVSSGVRPQEQAMQLTKEQAYLAMYSFLDKQFSLGCGELGSILGSILGMTPDR